MGWGCYGCGRDGGRCPRCHEAGEAGGCHDCGRDSAGGPGDEMLVEEEMIVAEVPLPPLLRPAALPPPLPPEERQVRI